MTNFTTKLMIATAAMVVAAGTASAQKLKADVPFSFKAGQTQMSAGAYEVTLNRAQGTLTIQNAAGSATAVILSSGRLEGGKAGDSKLVFACGSGSCSLLQAWSGTPGSAYAFPPPKNRDSEATRVVKLKREATQ